jgi:hypothetical protein
VRRLEFAGRVLLRLRIGRRSHGRSKAASARGITVCSSSRIPVKNSQGALLVSMQLHQSAYEQAQKLIRNFRFVLDQTSDWTDHRPPRHGQRKFIEEHGLAEFGKWHLGEDDEQAEDNKSRYKFPYGDFKNVHRCAVLAAESRASKYEYLDIALAAGHLRKLLDALLAQQRSIEKRHGHARSV